MDLSVHNVDSIRFVTNDEIAAVTAATSTQELGGAHVEDTAVTVLELASGSVAMTHESFCVPHARTSIELHGCAGSLYIPGVIAHDSVGDLILRRQYGGHLIDVRDRPDLYQETVHAFDAAVHGIGQVLCTGRDGMDEPRRRRSRPAIGDARPPVSVQEVLPGDERRPLPT